MNNFDSFIAKTTEEDLRRIEKDRIEINAAYDNVIFIFYYVLSFTYLEINGEKLLPTTQNINLSFKIISKS
jgi:hypothetical protein